MRKIFMIHFFFLLISLLVYMEGITKSGPDLVWNMMLALIAYDFAILTRYFKQAWLFPAFFILWLDFYPNTFYMLTDLVHMDFIGSSFSNVQSLIHYFLFLASILFGSLCGVESVNQLLKRFVIKEYYFKLFVLILLSVISSFAIHLGRYARLNSWDLVLRPTVVITELSKLLSADVLPFIVGFSFIQIMVLLFLDKESSK